jgi:hypothetical protein
MKYLMMFWVDESAEATPDEDAAMLIAVKSWVDEMTARGRTAKVEVRPYWDAPWDH